MNESIAKIVAVKGMSDILPTQVAVWQHVERVIRQLMQAYAYEEIRTPILERTQLFKRSIGEVTDIVEKEMFSFADQNGDGLTLRPEGTAGCVRSGIEHSLFRNQQQQKLWYLGPMFRYERPQKGRYRQFTQLGVEAFNLPGPDIDAEQLALCARLWNILKIDDCVSLQINSIGDLQSRNAYKQQLITYFNDNAQKLDEDSKRRLTSNPLRILDSKNPDMQQLINDAPVLLDYIDNESLEHFKELQQILTQLGINFTINPRIVRGLDYYNRTVFEWVTDKLGSQSAVCAGGRYDNLVSMLGGQSSNGVGFAIGLERIILLLEMAQQNITNSIDGYLMCIGTAAEASRLLIAERIRNQLPNFSLFTNMSTGSSFVNLFKKADKSGAKVALVVGDEEISNNTIGIKFLLSDRPQVTVALNQIHTILGDI
jgi:histidyl-tRNA synthetase